MSKEKYKTKAIFEDFELFAEDLQTGSNNYLGVGGGPGQAAMSLKPGKVTLLDLIKQADDWELELAKAPNRLPFPLQDGLSDQLGELYTDVMQIQNKVAQSTKSSIIKDNEEAYKAVKKIYTKLNKIGAAVKSIVDDIDTLGVGTSAPEDHA